MSDDGVGIGDDAVPGVGLRSMRERADELGGACAVGLGRRSRDAPRRWPGRGTPVWEARVDDAVVLAVAARWPPVGRPQLPPADCS